MRRRVESLQMVDESKREKELGQGRAEEGGEDGAGLRRRMKSLQIANES